MARHFNPFIDLNGRTPLFRGHIRDVYQHPEWDNALVKVIQADRVGAGGNLIPWNRKVVSINRTYGIYISFFREVKELLRAHRRFYPRAGVRLPFATLFGFAPTPYGLGLVVEKICAPDGSLAPTLARVLAEGKFTDAHQKALDAFFAFCGDHHIVCGDLHQGNLVFEGEAEGGRFVCVDGMGDKYWFNLHEWSAVMNRRKLERGRERIQARIRAQLSGDAPRPGQSALPAQSGQEAGSRT